MPPRHRLDSARPVVALCAVLLAPAALAGLGADGWPQARRDAARTGRTSDTLLVDPQIQWLGDAGQPLTGEPAVGACQVIVTNSGGSVVAFDQGDGTVAWSADRTWAIAPTTASSAVAVDDSGLVAAGLPGDAGIFALRPLLTTMHTAIESYAVDNGFYPTGPDLEPELVPVYISLLPWNPFAGRPMIFSDTPSPGDYRYQPQPPIDFDLAIWWVDGSVLDSTDRCGIDVPSWPLSPERGGSPTGLEEADGGLRFRILDREPAVDVAPAIAIDEIVWTSSERSERAGSVAHGRIRATALDGSDRWEHRAWGPMRGGAARDVVTGDLYVARGPDCLSDYLNSLARQLMTGVESFQVDNGFPPATGDLDPILVPTYLPCMPRHPIEDRGSRYSPTPSPGDYDYVYDAVADSYRMIIWGEDGTARVEMMDGGIVVQASDAPPSVLAYDAAGSLRWKREIGGPADDLSPVALRADGVVVFGTRGGVARGLNTVDGSDAWSTTLGSTLSTGPAVGDDGGAVFLSVAGIVFALDAGGGVIWTHPTGAAAEAAPTLTADGVVYAPGLDGTLRAIEPGGVLRWQVPLGGALRAGLTTAAVADDGWLFVGRDDGFMVGVGPAATFGGPPPVGNTFLLHRDGDDVVFDWIDVGGVPAACSHAVRSSADRVRLPSDPVTVRVPPDPARAVGVVPGAPGVVFYRVQQTTCCGVDGP